MDIIKLEYKDKDILSKGLQYLMEGQSFQLSISGNSRKIILYSFPKYAEALEKINRLKILLFFPLTFCSISFWSIFIYAYCKKIEYQSYDDGEILIFKFCGEEMHSTPTE